MSGRIGERSGVITEEEVAELLETPVQVVRNNSCDLNGRGERFRRETPSKRQIDSCLFDKEIRDESMDILGFWLH
jgi:hypothetical protein